MYGIAWYGTDHTNIIGISRKQEVSIKENYEHSIIFRK
jgi:hypothetical protein